MIPMRRLFLFWGVSIGKPGSLLTEAANRLGPVHMYLPARFEPDDVAILWAPFIGTFRNAIWHAVRAAGGRVIIVENGWLSPIGRQKYYQIALDGWNGTGRFAAGDAGRWASWNIDLKDWRRDGETILVIEQRSKGINGDPRAMPPGWAQSVEPRTTRRIVRRTRATEEPLDRQLDQAFATLTWTSTVAIKGLIRGVPAFLCGPQLNCSELMKPGLDVDRPVYPDRLPVFERYAWQQWSEDEVRSGEPFARLLELPHDGRPATFEDPAPVDPIWTLAGRVRATVAARSAQNPVARLARLMVG
jgi:hypothetical protein